jgi:hypothetical protein
MITQALVDEYFEHRGGKLYWKKANHPNKQYLVGSEAGSRGVSWHKKSKAWLVRVSVDGKSKIIGYFKDLELADLVGNMAREKYHGKFAHN